MLAATPAAGGASVDASGPPARGPDAPARIVRGGWLARLACVIVPIVIWLAPLPLAPATQHGMAIAAFMILGWATEVAEPALVGFRGCFLFWALKIVPDFRGAFTGFASDTAWFLFGALLI